MAYAEHKSSAQSITARCAIITLSDTRDESTDTSGQLIRRLLTESDRPHEVRLYKIIKDDPAALSMLLDEILATDGIDAVLTNGGTGIARRDQTIDVVARAIEIPVPGFGELFRMLSWEQIGPGAMLSRAIAGIARGKPIFAMPGSSKAVELAMSKLILPELPHILHELRK